MKFSIQQVALFPPSSDKAIELLSAMGMADWTKDKVVASGAVRDTLIEDSVGDLAFNYQGLESARELEVLSYKTKPHWMERHGHAVSHIGMHCSEAELLDWTKFFSARGIKVAQELYTKSHTNEVIAGKRLYHYVIFDTRSILGVDVKFIVRRDNPDSVLTECLVCGSHKTIGREFFKGHEWCVVCEESTNHIEVTVQ